MCRDGDTVVPAASFDAHLLFAILHAILDTGAVFSSRSVSCEDGPCVVQVAPTTAVSTAVSSFYIMYASGILPYLVVSCFPPCRDLSTMLSYWRVVCHHDI